MFLAGEFPHKIEADFCCVRLSHEIEAFLLGSRGFLWFWIMEVKMLWVQVMGVTLVSLGTASSQYDGPDSSTQVDVTVYG
jgi:hypothetical protein